MVKHYGYVFGLFREITPDLEAQANLSGVSRYVLDTDYAALEAELNRMTQSRDNWRDIAQRKEKE